MSAASSRPWYAHPGARAWRCPPFAPGVRDFHASLAGYAPTPLVELPALAAELGVGRLFLKDESDRFGLPAFKALGASWAVERALRERASAGQPRPSTLVCATDGNHGRAVARTARLLGMAARVVIAAGVHPAAVAAIGGEGAEVIERGLAYDDAVRLAADLAVEPDALLVQDTAWPGYESIPGWIAEGYATMCVEVEEQLAAAGVPNGPDLVCVPVGVGSLAQAVVTHYRSGPVAAHAPAILSVEPVGSACLLASLQAGEIRSVETEPTIMAGLACGTPTSLGWPSLRDGLDAAVAIDDEACRLALRDLAALGVAAGPCGGGALAGLRAALNGPAGDERRRLLGLGPDAVVVLLSTEGLAANPQGGDA